MITKISDFLEVYKTEYKAPPKILRIGGGLEIKEGHRINFLAGLPGTGKTSYLLKLSSELSQYAYIIVFISFEMNPQQLIERIISQHTQIGLDLIQAKRIEPVSLIEQVQRHINFNINICYAQSEKELIEDINSVRGERMFFIWDYLQKMSIKKGIDELSKINRNLDFITKTTKEYNAQSFIASSLNRGGYEKNELGIFRSSGEIEFAADLAILMRLARKNAKGEWEALTNGELDKERKNTNVSVLFNTLKNRHGQESSFAMQFKKDTQSFKRFEGEVEGEGIQQREQEIGEDYCIEKPATTETPKRRGRPRQAALEEVNIYDEL